LVNTAGPTSAIGIQLDSTYYAMLFQCWIEGVYATNVYCNGIPTAYGAYTTIIGGHLGPVPGGGTSGGTGILTNNHEHINVIDTVIDWFHQAGGIGIKIQNSASRFTNVRFDECDTSAHVYFSSSNVFDSCHFDRGITRFVNLQGGKSNRFIGNTFSTFSGVGSKNIMDVSDAGNEANVISSNVVEQGVGWTNFVVEVGGTGTPANQYIANETAGLGITQVSGVFRDNHGYNPVGSLTPPAANPVSNTVYANTQGVDATVCISGGTVTVIKIGGVTTGLTSGAFRVPAEQTITVTQSVNPSWTWFGD
jgi:hypothetical protein